MGGALLDGATIGLESGAQIALHDATRRAGTPDPRKIDVVFPSQATDDGRGPHPSVRGPLHGRRAAFLVLGRLVFLLLGRFDLRRGCRGRLIHAIATRTVLGLLGLAARWRLLALARSDA